MGLSQKKKLMHYLQRIPHFFYPTLKEILNLPLENSIVPHLGRLYYDFTRHKLGFDMF